MSERKKERKKEREREREKKKERERERDYIYVMLSRFLIGYSTLPLSLVVQLVRHPSHEVIGSILVSQAMSLIVVQ